MSGIEILVILIGLSSPLLMILSYHLGKMDGYKNGYHNAMVDTLKVFERFNGDRRKNNEQI